MHFERIEEQLAFHDWDAKPHLHNGLHQLMYFESGHGDVLIEDTWHPFQAPYLLFVPQGVVHGFHFSRDTAGPILTVSAEFMHEATLFGESDILSVTEQTHRIHLTLDQPPDQDIPALFVGIEHDYRWGGSGRTTALMARLALLLVCIARHAVPVDTGSGDLPPGYLEIYEKFRVHLEKVFRQQPSVAELAANLNLTEGRLTAICRAVSSETPQGLLHQRTLLEAKRQLLYSSRSSLSIAYMLGFKDPAYFSRFFKRCTGQSPSTFRRQAGQAPVATWSKSDTGSSGRKDAEQE
ncbi:helix-turn-helix domain-containing protein [Neopusillimonas aromaticivorans]|uniref:helix-turn-helix domain-containing protein n=1 Tax=Neopusillimonas aromaticivorans TaxID=2979868 RepID=UPI0025921D69|nr:helix-turn-helix domain-containing protein [Neopusillimonas aromaticivorans]WJJ94900.1 helix-turn-helix domain-containing protein [Neopusillimonas aromaticivorans]